MIDTERIDEVVLALLYLGLHEGNRTWKSFDWDAMARLHEKELITNPVGKAKSVRSHRARTEGVAALVREPVHSVDHGLSNPPTHIHDR